MASTAVIGSDAPLIGVLRAAQSAGFLGRGPVEEHVAHARAMMAVVPRWGRTFVDLGSGGGVPGLVVAVDRPESSGLLLDGSVRRVAFLARAVDELGLNGRIEVVAGRAETVGRDPAHRGAHGTVLSRAFGPPAVVAECAAPLLAVGGLLVVSDPPASPGQPDRWPADDLRRLGLRVVERAAGPPAFTVLEQAAPCPTTYPRRVGVPAKRPLF